MSGVIRHLQQKKRKKDKKRYLAIFQNLLQTFMTNHEKIKKHTKVQCAFK